MNKLIPILAVVVILIVISIVFLMQPPTTKPTIPPESPPETTPEPPEEPSQEPPETPPEPEEPCGDGLCDLMSGETPTNCVEDCGNKECVEEGERMPTGYTELSCCEGLYKGSCDEPDENDKCHWDCMDSVVCIKINDGECGPGENKCNSINDCFVGVYDSENDCTNRCGDGRCEPSSCVGSECSCVETAENCPADCSKAGKICADTDGGKEPYIRGVMTLSEYSAGDALDQCYVKNPNSFAGVDECSGLNCYVNEYYCNETESIMFPSGNIRCPNGCKDGACIH